MNHTDSNPAVPPGGKPATWLTWLQLMRLPTVFTAMSNILCGYLMTHSPDIHQLSEHTSLICLLLSSAGLYLGGMVLNDVFDAGLDAVERPERPLPSGRISRTSALTLAVALLLSGLLAAAAVGTNSLTLAVLLVAGVVAYDGFLKNTVVAPLGMGACRFLNILLGASAVARWPDIWQAPQLGIAAGLFVYIVGVTWFARHETVTGARGSLTVGLLFVVAGIIVDGVVLSDSASSPQTQTGALIALSLIAANLILRCGGAIRSGEPRRVQRTVGFMLLCVIFLDATAVFAVSGSAALGALVVALVVPATLMKRVIPMS